MICSCTALSTAATGNSSTPPEHPHIQNNQTYIIVLLEVSLLYLHALSRTAISQDFNDGFLISAWKNEEENQTEQKTLLSSKTLREGLGSCVSAKVPGEHV